MDAPEPDHWQPTPGSRQAEILDTVLHRGTVRVAELAEEFGVQPVTVRRDVAALSEAGLVRRVHGGVSALTKAGSNGSRDRKSTRLNSSHVAISYAVFCLKKKNSQGRRHEGGSGMAGVDARSRRP